MAISEWWMRLKGKPIGEVIKHKHRFVVMDTDTFKEKFSFQLSGTNLFVAIGITVIVFILLTTVLVAFTPLREWIPGYTDTRMVEQTYDNARRIDSLETAIDNQEWLIAALQAIVSGEPVAEMAGAGSNDSATTLQAYATAYRHSKEDSLLRAEVEQEDNRYQVKTQEQQEYTHTDAYAAHTTPTHIYFTPLRGNIVRAYDASAHHYGVDIAAGSDQTVVAAYGGTIVSASYTAEAGHTVVVQHPGNVVTIYRNNSAIIKRQGDIVRSGEPIAFAGGSVNPTTGPYMHFEIWVNGAPADPQQYISF